MYLFYLMLVCQNTINRSLKHNVITYHNSEDIEYKIKIKAFDIISHDERHKMIGKATRNEEGERKNG